MTNKIRRIIDFDSDTLEKLDKKRRELSLERGADISRNQAVNEAVKFWLESLENKTKGEIQNECGNRKR